VRRLAILLVLAAFLAAPAVARATDHVYLSLGKVRLPSGWTLSGAVSGRDYSPSRTEVAGVTLSKRVTDRATERHALRLHPARETVSFDGVRGRWLLNTAALSIDLKVTGRGDAVSVGEWLGCRGAFERRPVSLEGTFVLRTGRAPFGTVRRSRFAGTVIYGTGGTVECGATATGCEADAWLSASSRQRFLSVSPGRRTLTLSFLEGAWYHVLERSGIAVSGSLPAIRVVAAGLGSVTFSAGQTTETVSGGCRVATTEGTLGGMLAVRFAGWGARTFRATTAQYRQYSPV
jgi:hypothetical protein